MSYFGKSDGGGRRGTGRSPLAEQAVVSTLSSCSAAAVLDISRTGAKLRGVRTIALGDEVMLKLGKLQLFGIVRWLQKDVCGVEFDAPIPRHHFEELRRKEWAGYLMRRNVEQRLALEDWNTGLIR